MGSCWSRDVQSALNRVGAQVRAANVIDRTLTGSKTNIVVRMLWSVPFLSSISYPDGRTTKPAGTRSQPDGAFLERSVKKMTAVLMSDGDPVSFAITITI